jgi:hypothetical protein
MNPKDHVAGIKKKGQEEMKNPRLNPMLLPVLTIYLAGFGAGLDAATITAQSCNQADVQDAIEQAADGDTVLVPAGRCTWTSGVSISKALVLKGAGIGRTLITNDYPEGSLVSIRESTTGHIRIQGFDFIPGTGPGPHPTFFIEVNYASDGKPVLITANKFTLGSSKNALGVRTNRGVIWKNSFVGTIGTSYMNNASALRHKHGLTASWTTPAKWGTDDTDGNQNLYFEANTLTNALEGIDVDDNARTVIRYNTFTNSAVASHGADTSTWGGRYYECYGNTFIYDQTPIPGKDGELPVNMNSFTALRGGSAVIWNNMYQDINSGPCWGDKSEIMFQAQNLRRKAGPFPCWTGGYPLPHQVGWGYTTGRTQCGASDIRQDSEPVYLWGNTGPANYDNPRIVDYSPNECGCTAPSATTYIVRGRDYFVDTPKPNYSPYTYPHPLTLDDR